MPELPDLELIVKNLQNKLKGKIIKDVMLHVSKKTLATENELFAAFVHHKVASVIREGKELRMAIGENVLANRSWQSSILKIKLF